jgi:hypothetical protein
LPELLINTRRSGHRQNPLRIPELPVLRKSTPESGPEILTSPKFGIFILAIVIDGTGWNLTDEMRERKKKTAKDANS